MFLSERVLGTPLARQLREHSGAVILTIGKDRFSRVDFAKVACFNYVAVRNLSAAIATFEVRDTRDLFERVAPSALALPRVGSVALACLGAAFELKGLGGEAPLEAWVVRHRPKEMNTQQAFATIVTFHTIKHREAEREKQERKAKRARRQGTAAASPAATAAERGE